MGGILNLMGIVVVTGLAVLLLYLYKKNKDKTISDYIKNIEAQSEYDEDLLVQIVTEEIKNYTTKDLHELRLSKAEYDKADRKRDRLMKALKDCMAGKVTDRELVKGHLYDIITTVLNEDSINQIISFSRTDHLTVQDKFEILLYIYKEHKHYKNRAINELIKEYHLDDIKYVIENKEVASYIITKEEIETIFSMHYRHNKFSYEDQLKIVTQRIYQKYKGLGVVDELRYMDLDGISAGVSGTSHIGNVSKSKNIIFDMEHAKSSCTQSVWIMLSGKTIHLSFLDFGTISQLKRVVRNIYRYNKPGQLAEKNGYIINDLADGSRCVVGRPPMADSWYFLIRRHRPNTAYLPELIVGPNAQIVHRTLEILNISEQNSAITGDMGTGKTTLLMALIRSIQAIYPIRVQEKAFELNLRETYPERNILSFKETDDITAQEGLDLIKKTDGAVSIIGEVANAEVAALMIQMAQVASRFTLFTHHAKTEHDLIKSLRNNLLQTGQFSNERVAEEQVAEVINFNVHMEKDKNGFRYVSRITEIMPILWQDYSDDFKSMSDLDAKESAFMDNTNEYYKRATDKRMYETKNIIVYKNGQYIVKNNFSERTKAKMREKVQDSKLEHLEAFFLELEQNKGMVG